MTGRPKDEDGSAVPDAEVPPEDLEPVDDDSSESTSSRRAFLVKGAAAFGALIGGVALKHYERPIIDTLSGEAGARLGTVASAAATDVPPADAAAAPGKSPAKDQPKEAKADTKEDKPKDA